MSINRWFSGVALAAFFSVAGALVVSGCALTPVETAREAPSRKQPLYMIDVIPTRPPVVSHDGFEAGLTFSVLAQDRLGQRYLVQELTQTVTYEYADGAEVATSFSLVECFRLRYAGPSPLGVRYELDGGQWDRHFHTGLAALPVEVLAVRIERKLFVYVANVYGADFTRRGFAQLERNESGDVVTNSPPRFNAAYRSAHETRGTPRDTYRQGGTAYRIAFRLERSGMGEADFVIDRDRGPGRVLKPTLVIKK